MEQECPPSAIGVQAAILQAEDLPQSEANGSVLVRFLFDFGAIFEAREFL
jgi:hypothetical protein